MSSAKTYLGSGRGTVGKCTGPKWTKMAQYDHFGQNDLIPNWILVFARPKWTKRVHFGPFWPKEVHFGPFRSANRTLATPEYRDRNRVPYRRCGVDTEIPYRLPCWRDFCSVLQVRVASGVDTEFPYQVRIVDSLRGVDCRNPVCRYHFPIPRFSEDHWQLGWALLGEIKHTLISVPPFRVTFRPLFHGGENSGFAWAIQ